MNTKEKAKKIWEDNKGISNYGNYCNTRGKRDAGQENSTGKRFH